MQSALAVAKTENSSPQQFLLGDADMAAFLKGSHPDKSHAASAHFFAKIQVVATHDPETASRLHVLGSRPIFTDPIPV